MSAKPGWTRRIPGSESLPDGTFDQEGICSCVSPSDKLPLCERSAEGEERHPQDQAGVSQQKGFLEESNLFQLVLERKTCHGHRDCYGYCDHSGHRNQYGSRDRTGHRKTDMAIVRLLRPL